MAKNAYAVTEKDVLMKIRKLMEHLASKDFRRGLPARKTTNQYYLIRFGKCYAKAEQRYYTVKL